MVKPLVEWLRSDYTRTTGHRRAVPGICPGAVRATPAPPSKALFDWIRKRPELEAVRPSDKRIRPEDTEAVSRNWLGTKVLHGLLSAWSCVSVFPSFKGPLSYRLERRSVSYRGSVC